MDVIVRIFFEIFTLEKIVQTNMIINHNERSSLSILISVEYYVYLISIYLFGGLWGICEKFKYFKFF